MLKKLLNLLKQKSFQIGSFLYMIFDKNLFKNNFTHT